MVRWMILGVLLIAGCGRSASPITGCDASETMIPDCRFQNPEDLAVAPRGGRLLVSQMGAMDGSRSGQLSSYSPATGRIEVLFPTMASAGTAATDDRSWGDSDCPPPDLNAFSPHGIDLVRRGDGRWMLLAVNHGLRESVEFFEVDDDGENVSLRWRGCAIGPDQAAFNDVVARRDGGFYVSQMMPQDSQLIALLKGGLLGSDTGFIYRWSQGDLAESFSKVPGSEGPFPNGVELSTDEQSLYINLYLGGEVRRLDLGSEEVGAVAELESPDNSTWSGDGRLLVASHIDGLLETAACQDLSEGSCGIAFRIVALDPDDLEAEILLEHRGPPMGGATVAVEMAGDLYLGTFAGDRITRVSGAATTAP